MTVSPTPGSRLRAYAHFIVAVFYFFLARTLARHAAVSLVIDSWVPLVTQAILVFLLLMGYAAMGFWFNGQARPIRDQGLPLRPGWTREMATGIATGWAVAVVCVIPVVLVGGIAIVLSTQRSSWEWLGIDVAYFALFALAEEIAFRGYGFQRFVDAIGPIPAAVGFAAYYAVVQSLRPDSSHASFAVAIALTLVLSTGYLRTRALWLGWGINFGWKASRALIFGLAVGGVNSNSPIVQGNPMGPFWVTGGGFGLDGTWITFAVLLLAIPIVFRITRELDFRYNAPEILPAGIPVDLDAAARAQHEAAMVTAQPAAAPALVQIAPAAPPNSASAPPNGAPDHSPPERTTDSAG